MIDVNNVDLKNAIIELDSLINEYEEIEINLFNQLKDSCINWQDGNSIQFDNKIQLEKGESKLILESLKKQKDIYNYIYNKYNEIDKKIHCNLNNKNSVLFTIDNCYNETLNILDEFSRIDRSFYYEEQYSIFREKDRIIKIKNELYEIKISTEKMYDRIEGIEKEIKNKISSLEEIRINDFDFDT